MLQIHFAATVKEYPLPHEPVTVAPLAMHLPASYTTWRHITMFRWAFHIFLSRAKQTQSTSPTGFM